MSVDSMAIRGGEADGGVRSLSFFLSLSLSLSHTHCPCPVFHSVHPNRALPELVIFKASQWNIKESPADERILGDLLWYLRHLHCLRLLRVLRVLLLLRRRQLPNWI